MCGDIKAITVVTLRTLSYRCSGGMRRRPAPGAVCLRVRQDVDTYFRCS